MFRVGIHQSPDAVKKLMAFCADPSRGSLRYSETVFDCIRVPSLLIYNLMIRAFAKKGRFKKVLSLFAKLRGDGLSPDNFTYPFVFKATACLGEVSEGAKVHGFVVKSGLEFDAYVCNSIMGMYAELGDIECMKKVFEEMPHRDVVSWNVMISGYVRCGRFVDAINVFRGMHKCRDLKPDEATVVSTLSACAALKNLELGEEIHRYINKELGYTTLIIGNALLDMYCKCGCLSIAREFFDAMPDKNVICWTTMVSGYVNIGQLDEAKKLFERSPARDIVLWTSMINGYVQFNRFNEAVALFREMQAKRVKPDKFIVVALLTGCAQLGVLEQGKWIHEYIDYNRISIDAVLGTAIVDMYAKCGCIEKALKVFHSLKEKDTASWTSIICGLAMNGKPNEGLELFSEMERLGAIPDDITFIGVLSSCSHGGLVEEGRKLFDSMKHVYQIEPKLEHYGCLIDLLGRAGLLDEAEELIKMIPNQNSEVVVPLYGALLSACRTYENVGIGERVAKQLVNLGVKDSSVLTLLGNIYASIDRWEDVTKARRKMKELGVRKFPGCSSIEINGIAHEFLVGDLSHPEIGEIYSMLHRIAKSSSGFEQNEMVDENLPLVFL